MFSIEHRGQLIDRARSFGAFLKFEEVLLDEGIVLLRELEKSLHLSNDPRFMQNLLEIASFLRSTDESVFYQEVKGAFFLLIDLDKSKLSYNESRFLSSFYARAVQSLRAGTALGIWGQLTEVELHQLKHYQNSTDDYIDDLALINHALEVISELSHLSVGFVARFVRELRLLVDTLQSSNSSKEDQQLARNGLGYVFENDDVIPDEIGVLGLIDDMCVVRATAGYLNPNMAKISNDVETMLSKVPFLKDLSFNFNIDKTDYSLPLSDFTFQTFHPFFKALAESASPRTSKRLFIHTVGEASSIANLMAWMSAISTYALPYKYEPDTKNMHFNNEDLIAIDLNKTSIFEGFEKIGGITHLKLRSERTKGGQLLNTWQNIPIKDAGRILKAVDDRKPKGFASSVISDQNREISALATVFNMDSFPFISATAPRIFLVTSIVEMESFENNYTLFGAQLRKAIPTAKVREGGVLESFTGAVDPSEARLIIASSMHHLVDLEYEGGTRDGDIVIVDLATQRSRISALVDLQDTVLNIFIVGDDLPREVSEFIIKNDFSFMLWGKQNINSLLSREGVGYSWEKNLKSRLELDISATEVICPEAEEFHSAFRAVMRDVKTDSELKELNTIGFEVLSFFLNALSLTSVYERVVEALEILSSHIDKIEILLNDARYVEGETLERVRFLIEVWQRNGDKIIVAKTEELSKYIGLLDFVKPRPNLVASNALPPINVFSESPIKLLFPYWPTKRQLSETIKNPRLITLKLVLFSFEYSWFKSFLEFNEISKTVSDCLDPDYKHLFGMQERSATEDAGSEFDTIESQLRLERAKNKIQEQDSGPLAHPDRIYLCSDDVEVFATARSSFVVARNIDDNFEVAEIDGMGVRTGDYLIFVPHAESSAIRVLADRELEEGIRDTAKIWQREVRVALDKKGINLAEFRDRLQSKGLSRTATTISNWVKNDEMIAPRNYGAVLPLVFETLGLNLDIDRIVNAIQEVYSAHMSAARGINAVLKENLAGNGLSKSNLEMFLVHEIHLIGDYSLPYSQLSKPLRS